ncbi:hypothetical protein LK540_05155 [Massilia sp. IC2-278]|uniref:hypothetical protein n=1 Tax=Massilia sp. IC2-278 TaxID=2887200 RepID=UPI001E448070|nr:hypothetical protein [Massilia sp. IC2-278]MCC2959817.1 hypothetical protein [Massilia sp. IC2-278]
MKERIESCMHLSAGNETRIGRPRRLLLRRHKDGDKMSIRVLLAFWSMCAVTTSSAQDKAIYPAPAKPLTAEYTIYSGGIGDEQPPTMDDRKLAVEVKGKAAKDIFDSLYPDVHGVSCGDEKGERLRRKRKIWCTYSPHGGYRCFLGFNLRTGESISGGAC